MKFDGDTSGNAEEPPEILIDEVLKMDRLLYLKIIQEKEPITSLQVTRETLALKNKIKHKQVKNKEIKKANPNINKRLKDLTRLGILNDYEGEYSLSCIGVLIVDDLTRMKSNIEVLREYKDFFDTHDHTVIPLQQFREIYNLQFAKQSKDSLYYLKEITSNTLTVQHRIYIATERLHDIPGWIIEEIRKGNLELKIIYQFKKPFKINSDIEEELELWKKLIEDDLAGAEFRYISLENRSPLGIRIVDNKWAIFNLVKAASAELNRAESFFGTNEQFIAWIENVFLNIWKKSKKLEINKITVI
ncbi:MAG: hypothetical protein PVF58_00095 [Candidatus Methanofastidiosia archaeon]|jgi:predicted transcriptional regulator